MTAESTIVPVTTPLRPTAAVAVQPEGRALLRWVLVLGSLVALGPLTIDMYLPALPTIAADLGTSSATAQLTLTGTLFGLAVGQLVIGPLSDVLGRKRPLLVGTALHVLASLACIAAPDVAVLGGLRVLQGAGAAAAAVVAMAVVRDLFHGRAAATVLSRLMLVMGVAPVLAPTLGGILLTTVSWRGVFGALAVVGVALLVVGAVLLPETLPPAARRSGGLAPALRTYAALLRDRQFVALVGVAGLAMSALFAYVAGSSFVFQEEYALDEQQFAFVFAAGAVALIGASQLNVRLLDRRTPEQITVGALVGGVVVGVVLVVVAATGSGGLPGLLVPLWLLLGTVGLVLPNAPALALSRHGEAAGTAAALLGAVQFGFGALVSPVVGLLGNDSLAMGSVMLGGEALALVVLLLVLRRSTADG
ncbi:multidrug effflux MFS transporter [Rhodococcus antarcticus]|uniref:multidrug effflux MFS transporter n=1 Tax=Rhodococcus antarcticus TaxID=2987751 RepID=UPI003F491AE4